jgi:hypothetical protein
MTPTVNRRASLMRNSNRLQPVRLARQSDCIPPSPRPAFRVPRTGRSRLDRADLTRKVGRVSRVIKMVTTQSTDLSGRTGTSGKQRKTRSIGRPARAGVLGAVVALVLAAAFSWAAPAGATGSSASDAAINPAAAQASRCRIPTDADRAPLTDGTGSTASPDAATPVADPEAVEAAVDIDLVIRALAACLTAGDYQTVTDLASGQFLGVLAGTGGELDAATYVMLAEDQPTTPFRIRSVSAIQVTGEGQATADVVYAIANQLFHGRWTFTQVEGGSDATGAPERRWIVEAEQPMVAEPPADAAEIEVTLDEYEITIDPAETAGPHVVLSAENTGENEHEILVLRVDDGGDVQDLLTEPGPELPAGLVFGAYIAVPAGATATIPLVNLDPGTYAIVSLLLNAEGVSDLAQGMEAEFTISE